MSACDRDFLKSKVLKHVYYTRINESSPSFVSILVHIIILNISTSGIITLH